MKKIVEDDIMKKTSLFKIDLKLEKNLKPEILFPFSLKQTIKSYQEKLINIDMMTLRKDIREIYKLFCLKLINKSPLKYSLTKAISCFDPRVAIDKKIIASRFIDLISILADNSQHCNVIKHKKNLKI